jgi:outer membrane protein OmpA-like peptidoglycan-associated protein
VAIGEFQRVRLPNGVELNVPSQGVEKKLVEFLASARPGSASFDFDRIAFDAGKGTLQAASQEQLQNIAAILLAYPDVRLQIGGDTDDPAQPAKSVAQSAERARSVAGELVKAGVDPERLSLAAYEQENEAEAIRARIRLMSMRLTAK